MFQGKTYERIVAKTSRTWELLVLVLFGRWKFWALKQTCQILRGSFHLHVEFLGRLGWLYIIQLSMIQSSIYSTVSLWPNWSYSSNSKNILLRTFVCWFITFRKNPKCIEESIPIRRLQTFCSSKGVCKNWPRQKGFRWKGNIPVLLLGSQIGHQALLLVGGHPYGAGEVLELCGIGHWEIEERDVLKYTVFGGLFALEKPRVVHKKIGEPRWYSKKISGCTIDRALTVFSLGKNTSIHWASILVLLEFSYAIIFLLHLQMLRVSKRDSRGLKKKIWLSHGTQKKRTEAGNPRVRTLWQWVW